MEKKYEDSGVKEWLSTLTLEERGLLYGCLCAALTQRIIDENTRYNSIAVTNDQLIEIQEVAKRESLPLEVRGNDIIPVKVNNDEYGITIFCIFRGGVVVDFYWPQAGPDSGYCLAKSGMHSTGAKVMARDTGIRRAKDVGTVVRKTLGWSDIIGAHEKSELIQELNGVLNNLKNIYEKDVVVSEGGMECIKSLERKPFPLEEERKLGKEYIVLLVSNGKENECVVLEGIHMKEKGFLIEDLWRLGID